MKNRTLLAASIAATLGGAGPAEAASVSVLLQSVVSHTGSGTAAANISSSTATWSYDTDTGLLTQTGGVFNARYTIAPSTTLFRHSATGLVIGGGGAASATGFTCTEGNFGGNVGASICGNYNFGANFYNESTAAWGPGTAASRTLGGDDMALGPQQSVGIFNGVVQISWVGTTLTLSNATATSGYTWVLNAPQVILPGPPVPGFTVLMSLADGHYEIYGIQNLDINGTRYDVHFGNCSRYIAGDCDYVNAGGQFWGDPEGATAAVDAINGALNAAVPGHSHINGSEGEGYYEVPYGPWQSVAACESGSLCGPYPAQWSGYARIAGSFGDPVYFATFSLAAVPLPAAAWLFGGALLALRALKRRAA